MMTLRTTQERDEEGLMDYHQPGQGTYLHQYLTIMMYDTAHLIEDQIERTKRRGDFPFEISPLLSDFLKTWFGFQITTDRYSRIARDLRA